MLKVILLNRMAAIVALCAAVALCTPAASAAPAKKPAPANAPRKAVKKAAPAPAKPSAAPAVDPMGPKEPYRGAIALDAANGRVLFADGADIPGRPASLTKLMTCLLVMEDLKAGRYRATDPVRASRYAAGMEPSNLALKPGDVVTVEDLLYAIMVKSANDAAVMLAEHSAYRRAGGREAEIPAAEDSEALVAAFVARMNRRAQELGMAKTRYASPNGLPPPKGSKRGFDVSTARDLAKLAREAVRHPELFKYTSAPRHTVKFANAREPLTVYSHNYFLPGTHDPKKYCTAVKGCDGLKTGYTEASGSSIMLTGSRNGRRVVVVVMSSRGRWNRERAAAEIFGDALNALSIWN